MLVNVSLFFRCEIYIQLQILLRLRSGLQLQIRPDSRKSKSGTAVINSFIIFIYHRDFPHDGDNKYMLSNPNNSEDKTKFKQIVRNYCRSDSHDFSLGERAILLSCEFLRPDPLSVFSV